MKQNDLTSSGRLDSGIRCDGMRRRDFLHVGLVGSLGLGLADLFRLRAVAGRPGGRHRAKSCILIWLDGGPSHLEMFDPKPDAPIEVRGDFNPIETSVSGLRICEHLPRTARIMKDVALIRSLTHELGNHDTGSHYLLTGHRPTPVVEYPSLGSIVARETAAGEAAAGMPPYVAIPDSVRAGRAGYFSSAFDPFAVGGDPSKPDFRVRDLELPEGIRIDRIERRRTMQRVVDDFSRLVENHPGLDGRDAAYEQAYRLLTAPEAKAAFDHRLEPAAVRERYGRSRLGTGCLLARRLVEAGSRFVTVVDRGWDMHQQIFKTMPDAFFPGSGKLPALDRAYSSLITDLKERGLLDSTLVILMGEFGRTPKLNSRGGRDHWPRAGSVVVAGAGVPGGEVIGKTDAYGEVPADRPVRPEDLAASMLHLLGIDPSAEYVAPGGRPLKLMAEGEIIREIASA